MIKKVGLHLGCGKIFLRDNDINWINIDAEHKDSTRLNMLNASQQKKILQKNGTTFYRYYKYGPKDYKKFSVIVDRFDDIRELKNYKKETIKEIVVYHVLEHFVFNEAKKALKRWSDLLVKGGKLRVMVPNTKEICSRIVGLRNEGHYNDEYCYRLLYGSNNRTNELDGHKYCYSVETLTKELQNVGLAVRFVKPPTDNKFNPSILAIGVKK